jgi:hypothetical protein
MEIHALEPSLEVSGPSLRLESALRLGLRLLLRSSGLHLGLEQAITAGLELCLGLRLSLEELGHEVEECRLSRFHRWLLCGRRWLFWLAVGGEESGSRYQPAAGHLLRSGEPAGGEVSPEGLTAPAVQLGRLLYREVVSAEVRRSRVEPARGRTSGRR